MKNWWAKTANSQIKDSITIRMAGTVRKLLEMCRKQGGDVAVMLNVKKKLPENRAVGSSI